MGPVCDVNEPRKNVSVIPGLLDGGETLKLRRVRETRISRPEPLLIRPQVDLIKRPVCETALRHRAASPVKRDDGKG